MQKTVIITGASRGIGRETAKVLAQKGYKVIGTYLNSKKEADILQEELKKKNIEVDFVKADVSKREDVQNLVNYVIGKYKKIDILINNAGISEYKLFTDIKDEDWKYMIDTNLYSVFCMTQEVVKHMIHEKNGCIINISSIWGLVGASCESCYSISKAGIDNLTKSLAKELGLSNIRINSIAPGIIKTDMNKNLKEEELNDIKQEIPLQKIGEPIDITKCIEWLIEDSYTTGQIISINGGWVIT